MSMDIGPMLRAVLGDMVPADARALELRIGQIVRGVLVEMLENKEALINISGTLVRAKLQTDMPAGRGTLLQVQPGSTGGMALLKPLPDTSEILPDDGLKNILKTFGLPDQKWSHELVRGLKRDGFPVSKDTAAYFKAASAFNPPGSDTASWMTAADVAFRRGLPATEESIASLRQALFGQPLHEGLSGLDSSLKEWQAGGGAKSPQAAELAVRLTVLLGEGQRLLAQGEAQLLGNDPAGTADAESDPASAAAGRQPAPRPDARGGEPAASGATAAPGGTAGVPAGQAHADPLNPRMPAQASPQAIPGGELPAATEGKPVDTKPALVIPGTALSADAPSSGKAEARGDPAWIGRFLDWLGAGHERGLLSAAGTRPQGDAGTWSAAMTMANGEQDADSARSTADSLKSALMSLARSDETPPVLRDAAQSLVNQITGQQLLLASERQSQTPFSMMTMFIPMKGQDGDSTAAVHVQARRSRQGQWDTDNCRLLFDLRMRHLGDTLVDVQVVDRIVSVKLMNDFPEMAEMVETARDELAAGLKEAGFQLFSMTAQPLPKRKEASSADAEERNDKAKLPLSGSYAAKPYKGVDFRA